MSELTSLAEARGKAGPGGNPVNFIELVGGAEVTHSFYEPDPYTSRTDYYYNTRSNQLFKLITAKNPSTLKNNKYWKLISECS